jgi:mxaJ protein
MKHPFARPRPAFAATALAAALLPAAALAGASPAPQRELVVCADPSNLPYSNTRGEGFENRIARLLADDLGASLRYVYNQQRRSFLRRTLHAGLCDVVIGLPTGLEGVRTGKPYYTSSYAFVTARSRHLQVEGFDDPALRKLTIGLQAIGAEGSNPPPAESLAARGIVDHIVGFPMWAEESVESPPARILDAVADGSVDVAIVWGPFAGYFARGKALEVTPVAGDPAQPELAYTFPIALGVRKADAAFLEELDAVLARRRAEVDAILNEFGVPRVGAAPSDAARSAP